MGRDKTAALLTDDPGLAEVTESEREALAEVVGNRFWIVQNVLWETEEAESYGRIEREYAGRVVAGVDSALSRLRGLSEEAMLYRAGPAPPEDGVMLGYVFGTIDPETAAAVSRADELWEVHVPRRTPVLLLSQVVAAANLTPFEVLVPRRRRFMLISMARRDSPGRLRLEVT
ncbi:MAG TPA: hypothetical protein VF520_06640 [Thermoleophilaceae bacterium]|jgi:uncharacterized protein YciI